MLSISLLVVAGYYWKTYRDINNNVPRLTINAGQASSAPGSTGDIDGKDQNILLVGDDDRSNLSKADIKKLHAGESSGGSLATDTMIIVHVPADGSKATLISIPRDSYVKIKGFGMSRANAAYTDGYHFNVPSNATLKEKRQAGIDLLYGTLQNLTGLTIDHFIQIDLLGFYRIANALNGVTVNLCHSVDDSKRANLDADPPLSGGSGLVLSKGKHVLLGVQALQFVRQRHFLPNGDLDRVRRQQYFLTAAFRKVASVGILTKLGALGDAVEKSVFIDDGLNLIDLGKQLQNLQANNIISRTIPTTRATIDGQDVQRVDVKQVQSDIRNLLNPKPTASAPTTSSPTAPSAAKSSPAAIDTKCVN